MPIYGPKGKRFVAKDLGSVDGAWDDLVVPAVAINPAGSPAPPTLNNTVVSMSRRVVEIECRGFFARWMVRRGWGGCTIPLPFFTIILYWLASQNNFVTPGTRNHEKCHACQAARWGWFGWWVLYTWQVLRYGYRSAPFEVEAYISEDGDLS